MSTLFGADKSANSNPLVKTFRAAIETTDNATDYITYYSTINTALQMPLISAFCATIYATHCTAIKATVFLSLYATYNAA